MKKEYRPAIKKNRDSLVEGNVTKIFGWTKHKAINVAKAREWIL